MSLTLNYTTASSNLPDFLGNWATNSDYRGSGWFNSVFDISDQWMAGSPGGVDKSSVVVNGDDFSFTPGVVDGVVDNLELGTNLSYNQATDQWVQDEGLVVDFNGSALTSTFDAAITDISQNGSLDALFDYFAEQGTEQIGTTGNDVMLSFGGDDTFTGNAGDDTFVFGNDWANDVVLDFGTTSGDNDTIDLSGISNITGYVDLYFNHTNWWDSSSVLTISDGSNSIELAGYVGTDAFALLWDGNIIV